MASTNKTTNYELSQFIETDKPAWLTDYNGDMRTIDSTMKAISDVASGASGSISELADRMSTAEGNITTNTNDIDALEARADALEAQAQSTAGTIANIQTEQTAQNLGIEAATELGYNLARPYDSASTYAVGDYVLFQNTLYKCITAVPVGEAFDATKWLAIKATDEINAGGYTLPTASANTLGGVKVGNGLSIDETGILSSDLTIETTPINSFGNITIAYGSAANLAIEDSIGFIIGDKHILCLNLNFDLSATNFAVKNMATIEVTPNTNFIPSDLQLSADSISYSISSDYAIYQNGYTIPCDARFLKGLSDQKYKLQFSFNTSETNFSAKSTIIKAVFIW